MIHVEIAGQVHEAEVVKVYKNGKRDVLVEGKKTKVAYQDIVHRCADCTEFIPARGGFVAIYEFLGGQSGPTMLHTECSEKRCGSCSGKGVYARGSLEGQTCKGCEGSGLREDERRIRGL